MFKNLTFTIYTDPWLGNHKKWCARLQMGSGAAVQAYAYGFKTRKSLIEHLRAVAPGATIYMRSNSIGCEEVR